MIQVEHFCKEYDRVQAANDVSFEVPRGVIGALIGPNGAGKTTTMRALCGIVRPTSGRLLISGIDIQHEPIAAKQRIAYVPDDPPLFESLTVEEHLRFIASAYDVHDFDRRAGELLEQMELSGKRYALASELSRGMRQKVAIACAYIRDPEVLMLDEPLTGLDPVAIRMLKQTLVSRASGGTTVLISSHLLALVEDISQHLVILSGGRCLFSGTPASAQEQFGASGSLEDVFFRATQVTKS